MTLRTTFWYMYNRWWSTLKSALFGINMTLPPTLKPDGSLTHDPKEKATLFANVFDRKQNNDKLTMPHTFVPEAKLTALAFKTQEIKTLLLDLDARGGAGPEGIFLLFFKKDADVLCSKIAVNFHKCARLDNFSTCWRVGNVPALSKCESGSSCPSNYCRITITPVL